VPVLSDEQLAALLRKAGVDAGNAAYLVAIAHPESGANPQAVQQGQPYSTEGWGLWQITPGNSEPNIATNSGLLNAQKNADAAAAKLHSQGLGAWTTYSDGAFQPYFAAAKQAVSKVYGFPMSTVDQLVSETKGVGSATGAGSGGDSSSQIASFMGSSGGVLKDTGSLLHGAATVIDRIFALFAPGQGWRIVFGVGAAAFLFLSWKAFTGGAVAI
jgi:hypothetical protein